MAEKRKSLKEINHPMERAAFAERSRLNKLHSDAEAAVSRAKAALYRAKADEREAWALYEAADNYWSEQMDIAYDSVSESDG